MQDSHGESGSSSKVVPIPEKKIRDLEGSKKLRFVGIGKILDVPTISDNPTKEVRVLAGKKAELYLTTKSRIGGSFVIVVPESGNPQRIPLALVEVSDEIRQLIAN